MTVGALWYLFEQPVIVPNEPADSLAPSALVGSGSVSWQPFAPLGIGAVRYRRWAFGFDLGVAW